MRMLIPKGEGKTRPLGITTVTDKVLQGCAADILSGIYEEDFLPFSFGYRPHRGAKEAVMALREGLRQKTGVHLFIRFRKRDSVRFNFLGFEFRWGRSRTGVDVVKQRTNPKRYKLEKASS
jgi:hypothetical protein